MPQMPFTSDQLSFLKEHIPLWLAEQHFGKPMAVYEMEIHERIVRVEEELKHQRHMIQHIIDQMDKRFEQMDKRFDALTRRMDRFMIWSFGTSLTMAALIIGILKYT